NVDEPPPPEEDFDDVVVRIRREGNRTVWQINDAPVDSLQSVRDRLQLIAEINSAAPVILHPDGATPLGDVIDVYDLARLAGFEKVRFAASQKI
ncbi:MAG: biopolymer transporter ExbD, partial [Planctomycetales bacterium]|nr:biopolymer transporter ExbD [Planctomycetales bacterium]